jgi:hypothetical protein
MWKISNTDSMQTIHRDTKEELGNHLGNRQGHEVAKKLATWFGYIW